jgi:hypothetical protein
MNLFCLLGRHKALPTHARNLGLSFSQCRCCGRDLVHRRGRWTETPRGFRIVWRRLDEVIAEAVPLRLVRNLPVLSRRAQRQSLADMARRTADMAEFLTSSLIVAGWMIADKYRVLRLSLLAPLLPRQLVLPF